MFAQLSLTKLLPLLSVVISGLCAQTDHSKTLGSNGITSTLYPSVPAAIGYHPRIVVIADSILNASTLATGIQTSLPGSVVALRAYGGSESAIGGMLAARDVQIYGQVGNLLPTTTMSNWSKTNATVVASVSSTTGRSVYLDTSTDPFNRINADVTVPAGAPDMSFGVEMEPGTNASVQITIVNSTAPRVGTINSAQWGATDTLPRRYYLWTTAADGTTYQAGDVLHFYIYTGVFEGVTGTAFLTNPLVNVGASPTVYQATTGTPEVPATAAWVTPTPGFRRKLYDLAVVEFGRNDYVARPPQVFGRSIEAIVAGAAQFASTVLVVSPPPLADSGLSNWVEDTFITGGYLDAMRQAAERQGAGWYDAVAEFKALTTAGTYTIEQLMRDAVHPQITTAASPGIAQYIAAIVAYAKATPNVPTKLANPPMARIGCQPTSGTWAWGVYIYSGTATSLADLIGMPQTGLSPALGSTSGDCTAVVSGSNVGVLYLADATAAGSFTVSVDGQPATTVNEIAGGLQMQPHGVILSDDLAPGSHTITITVASGEARILGLVGW